MSFIYLFHCNAPLITLYDYPRRTTMLVALFSLQTYRLYTNGQILRNAFMESPVFLSLIHI